jgi:outer membrane protein TolC
VSRAALNLAMGQDIETPLELPGAFDAPAIEPEDLSGLIRRARESRRDLLAATHRLQAADQMVRVNRAGRLPEVGLSGAYEANAEDFIGADGTNWSVFLMARFTIFDGKQAGERVVRAQEERRAAQEMTEVMRQAVGLEVVQAFHELQAARQRLALAEASVTQAGESLRIVEDRYKEGLTMIVELLGAQTTLTAARTREVSARRDVLLGRATLDLAVGRL